MTDVSGPYRYGNGNAGEASAIPDVLFERGLYWASGRSGVVNLVAAHKWFNLAALSGCTRGQECRAEIALEMTAREIAEAQRQARSWLVASGTQRRAA